MTRVRIIPQSKSAMQSGRARTGLWVIEHEPQGTRSPDPLMGWTSANDTKNQIMLRFRTVEEAVEFSRANGWEFTVAPEQHRHIRPRNYGDNFRYIPPAEGA